MKLFRLSFTTVMFRSYLMMAAVIIAGFTGMWWLALLALPIFLSCLIAVSFTRPKNAETSTDRPRRASTTGHQTAGVQTVA